MYLNKKDFKANDKIVGFALCELAGHFLVASKVFLLLSFLNKVLVNFLIYSEEEDFNGLEESEIVNLASTSKLEPDLLNLILNDIKDFF